jgi:hypothetical protein
MKKDFINIDSTNIFSSIDFEKLKNSNKYFVCGETENGDRFIFWKGICASEIKERLDYAIRISERW